VKGTISLPTTDKKGNIEKIKIQPETSPYEIKLSLKRGEISLKSEYGKPKEINLVVTCESILKENVNSSSKQASKLAAKAFMEELVRSPEPLIEAINNHKDKSPYTAFILGLTDCWKKSSYVGSFNLRLDNKQDKTFNLIK
jgi:hypothetical protein